MTEQQKHLQQLVEQSNQLANEINVLNNQVATKRELFLKVQGVIEYLEQTGVTLATPEAESEKKEEESEEPKEEA